MDDSGRFLVALLIISVIILGAVSLAGGPNSSGLLNSIFGGTTYLNGSGGGTLYSNGTLIGNGVIVPAQIIQFKTSIVADFTDGTNSTIFQQSNLPGLAVITVHGKPIKDVTVLTLVGLTFLKPTPAGTIVDFSINYTDTIEGVGVGWWFREVQDPVVGNNNMALTAFPPISVLPSDIFPTALAKNVQRRVTWTANVVARVIPPVGYQLSLAPIDGSSVSFAEVNGDFSLGGGCTNCAGSNSGTVGGVGLTRGNGATGAGCAGNCPGTTTVGTVSVQVTLPNGVVVSAPANAVIVSGTQGTGGTEKQGGTKNTERLVNEARTAATEREVNSGNINGQHGIALSFIQSGCDLSSGSSACGLPAFNYTYLQIGGQTYMLNPRAIGLVLLLVVVFGFAMFPEAKKRS